MRNMVYFNISSIFLIIVIAVSIMIIIAKLLLIIFHRKYPKSKLPFEEKDLNTVMMLTIMFSLVILILFIRINSQLKATDFRFFIFTAPIILIMLQIYKLLFKNNNLVDLCYRIQKWIIRIIKWFIK